MNNQKIASLILTLRKSKGLTQKELAEKLCVTDKAVSKWERGLSCPDISLLAPLAEILGITISELLSGEENEKNTTEPEVETFVEATLEYADKATKEKIRNFNFISASIYSLASVIGMITCLICDVAISRNITWSFVSVISIIFAWFLIMPILLLHKKGIKLSLIALTISIVPFISLLEYSLHTYTQGILLSLGIKISIISLIYLWIQYFAFNKMTLQKYQIASISTFLIAILSFFINIIIYLEFSTFPDISNLITTVCLLAIAFAIYLIGYLKQLKL